MKLSIIILAALILTGCGKKSKNKGVDLPDVVVVPVVSCKVITDANRAACTDTFDWRIESTSDLFPKNYQIEIDGVTYFNTCKTKTRVATVTKVDRNTVISFENFRNVTSGTLSLKIIDKGALCDNDAVFFFSENTEFKMKKLGPTKYLIEVKLNN
ncbi:MAG TPA: hypothetical protein VNJ01_11155 [Bacteriovoracaceae bacterium]|nr:hypothetical protein [Bacteriovoracaceae bacterium]